MTIEDIRTIFLYGGGGLILLLTLVQITPIKINPWTWLARRVGRAINGEVLENVSHLKEDVKDLKDSNDEEWASLSRSHILRFGDELLHGVAHSKEHFDQILIDISKYKKYCAEHPDYLNDVANATMEQIQRTYQKCLEDNSFL